MAKLSWKPGNMLYPVPAVMVSCKREGERPNIITVAWAGTVNTNPPMVSISVRPERYSYNIIKETGEFVINLVTKELVYATDFCGVRSGKDVDKFSEMKLHETESKEIKAPGIAESFQYPRERLAKYAILLELVIEKGRFDLNASGLTAYSHGEYFELGKKLGKFGFSVNKKSDGKESKKPKKTDKAKKTSGKASKKNKNRH